MYFISTKLYKGEGQTLIPKNSTESDSITAKLIESANIILPEELDKWVRFAHENLGKNYESPVLEDEFNYESRLRIISHTTKKVSLIWRFFPDFMGNIRLKITEQKSADEKSKYLVLDCTIQAKNYIEPSKDAPIGLRFKCFIYPNTQSKVTCDLKFTLEGRQESISFSGTPSSFTLKEILKDDYSRIEELIHSSDSNYSEISRELRLKICLLLILVSFLQEFYLKLQKREKFNIKYM